MPAIDIATGSWLIFATAFIAIFLFCMGISQFTRQRTASRDLIKKIKGSDEIQTQIYEKGEDEPNQSAGKSPLLSIFGKIGKVSSATKSIDHSVSKLRFLKAGIRNENAISAFWGAKIFFGLLFPLMFIALRLSILNAMTYQATMIIGILCALLGFYLPDIWLRQKTDKRKEKMLKAMPDALDLLVICVEAGMGLDAAINRIAQELKLNNPDLADEFQLMTFELRAGKQRQSALRNLALRSNLDEMESLVTLLIQTDKFGTSMADALRVYAETYRTERYQRAEELAAKIPIKLLFPMLIFIFPSLFLIILGPAAISIYQVLIANYK